MSLWRSAGTDWSVRSSNWKATLPLFSAMKIPVSRLGPTGIPGSQYYKEKFPGIVASHIFRNWILTNPSLFEIAGLTVGDPVYRTGNPLSVELGPGKYQSQNIWLLKWVCLERRSKLNLYFLLRNSSWIPDHRGRLADSPSILFFNSPIY